MKTPVRERFELFMARALHDPAEGYYRQGLRTVGRGGDFSTSATLFPELGQALAFWIVQKADRSRLGPPVHVIEVGGGTGELMQEVLCTLGWWRRRRFCFHSVERSIPLRAEQRKRLERCGVRWHEDMGEALRSCGGRALIYSNELVDAFPCEVWGFQEGAWKELVLSWEGKEAVEEWVEPGPAEFFSKERRDELVRICPGPKAGQRLEIPRSYRDWLQSWLLHWKAGAMLSIDYGEEGPALVRNYPYGTLRAYFKQLRLEGEEVYRRVGRQDITYDVNFSLLKKWGEDLGLETGRYQSQADFLAAYGKVGSLSKDSPEFEAQERFLVLEQIRSPEPAP